MHALLLTAGLFAAAPNGVFVTPAEGASLIATGATVIDARGAFAKSPYLPRAQVIDWMRLRDGLGRTGRLGPTPDLTQAFAAAGVSAKRPVLVYGAADDGWGEEGRLWWTLRYLGHPRVHILDGGVKAWLQARRPTVQRPPPTRRGTFAPAPIPRLKAAHPEVRDAKPRRDVVVLDVRTAEEYAGATPYLSSRGGHVPGARHLEWRALLDADGRLKPEPELRAVFEARGVTKDQRVITYCTGGVRSAFVIAVLAHLGHPDVANYDGSWWDWAERDALPVARPTK